MIKHIKLLSVSNFFLLLWYLKYNLVFILFPYSNCWLNTLLLIDKFLWTLEHKKVFTFIIIYFRSLYYSDLHKKYRFKMFYLQSWILPNLIWKYKPVVEILKKWGPYNAQTAASSHVTPGVHSVTCHCGNMLPNIFGKDTIDCSLERSVFCCYLHSCFCFLLLIICFTRCLL